MFAQSVTMSTILRWALPRRESQQVHPGRMYPKIGRAHSADLARRFSRWRSR